MSEQDQGTLYRALETKAINAMSKKDRTDLQMFLARYEYDGMEGIGFVPPEYQSAVDEYYRLYATFIVHGEGAAMPHYDTGFMKIT